MQHAAWHGSPSDLVLSSLVRATRALAPRWRALRVANAVVVAAVAVFAICQVANMAAPGVLDGFALLLPMMELAVQTDEATNVGVVLSGQGVWVGSGYERPQRLKSSSPRL